MSWLDMHIHSRHSDDAEFAPEVLMEMCQIAGVKVAAVANHNSTAGVRAAAAHADACGVTLVPAVELDCLFGEVGLHVLGYWINPDDAAFARIEADIHEQELANAKARIRLVQQYGIFVDEDEVMAHSRGGVVTGELLCQVALRDARNRDNPKMQPFYPGGAWADNAPVNFYWQLCAQGKPAYVHTQFISLAQALSVIHGAGGLAVLAHPGNNIHEDEALLHGIARAGVQGMEVYSSYHSPHQTAFYRQKAEEMGLAATCGSDFHGKTKPKITLGCIDCDGREEALLADLQALRG